MTTNEWRTGRRRTGYRWTGNIVAMVRLCGMLALMIAGTDISLRGQNLPEGEGRDVVESVCSQCHGLRYITDSVLEREGWENIVADMMSRGAPLDDSEVDMVVDYLTASFGPAEMQASGGASAAASTNLPTGAGMEATQQACSQCHGINKLTRLKLDRHGWELTVYDMIARGAHIYEDEMDEIIDYLVANFGK
jgi:mono/diheme cytochrome c family protein